MELCSLLKENLDIFAWQPLDMTEVPRGQSPECAKAIQAEVQKLVEVGIMREVYYHDWLSNPVMVKKHDGSWLMCMDFTDLNKACPQDCYPLLEIDLKVESLYSYPFKCFLDVYKGYHQIHMAESDEEKTTFHTSQGTEAVLQLSSPRTIKEVQSLNGKLASLNRLLSKSAEKSLSLFKTLKKCIKKSDFHWTPKAEQAFKQLKKHLSELPLRALQGPELNYTPIEKLVQSLVFAAKRLQSVMLGEHNITYRLRTSVKGQILADFLVEKPDESLSDIPMVEVLQEPWTLFTDGSSFTASNNEAEYEALIAGLQIAAQMGVRNVHVLVEILKEKSIQEGEVATAVEEEGPTWMTPIMEYLKDGTLPGDRKEASKLCIKARQYELLDGILYKRSFLKPWLRCVGPLQADYMIREIHEGSCSMHAGPRSVVAKAMRLGYYWPTMHRDARDMIRTCNDCQIHHLVPRNPQQPLTPITAPWPFYKWGINIAGPFPKGPGKVKFLIVVMDYFTKWIEAKAVATIIGNQVKKFVETSADQWTRRKSKPELGTEAVIPAEIEMPTYRTAVVDATHNDEELWLNFDLLEERRERAAIREAKAKSKMTKHYNARVRGVTFRPGDFVYRNNDASHAVDGGKLDPKWEGPYEVMEALGDGAYKLRSTNRTVLPRTWDIANLKKCYL
ncbi:reverse transcriptase domain-containing protein [Tanacetum coccineum]|uniref:Reverse transcriptase domain-containing protein n=1 Tax=Tanacetum coccineum TaxID=301880 RepID=A0ABQ4Y8S3_9ASTR